MSEKRIRIFDTTLRDGEQAPGASLYPEEKTGTNILEFNVTNKKVYVCVLNNFCIL